MPNKTNIGWTDYTSNPLQYHDRTGKIVWGCVRTSPGCAHCYAATLARRYGRGGKFTREEMAGLTPFWNEAEARKIAGMKILSGKRVFLHDMTDLWGDWVPSSIQAAHFRMVASRRDVTFQILTKRPDRRREWLSSYREKVYSVFPHVWEGVSVENEDHMKRVEYLLMTPAAVRFVSAEPLLGPINFRPRPPELRHLCIVCGLGPAAMHDHEGGYMTRGLDWIIVGGETGPGHRPMKIEWLEQIVEDCQRASVPVFVNQASGPRPGMQGNIPNRLWRLKEFPDARS